MEPDSSVLETLKIGEGKPGPGRPKGLPNKTTALLKDAILQAARMAGDKYLEASGELGDGLAAYLTVQASSQPAAFMSLLGKVLPMQVTGSDGKDLVITVNIGGDAPNNG